MLFRSGQAERQRRAALATKRRACGPFCACCPARHAGGASLPQTLGITPAAVQIVASARFGHASEYEQYANSAVSLIASTGLWPSRRCYGYGASRNSMLRVATLVLRPHSSRRCRTLRKAHHRALFGQSVGRRKRRSSLRLHSLVPSLGLSQGFWLAAQNWQLCSLAASPCKQPVQIQRFNHFVASS